MARSITVIPVKQISTAESGTAQSVQKLKMAAYCRVSTDQEEQLLSYENQVNYYTNYISENPLYEYAGTYADEGISGTNTKKRDEFNKLIRQCKRGKVDMIIVKSISRFARNTLDCLKITRMLRELKVDVYFEEQNLHSIDPSSEFYISIYGSVAQSESENISHNVAWGKARSAKDGNVFFAYKSFLGYRRGADGKPEIDPEQANTVRRIYDHFLAGNSLQQIANGLTADGIPTPMGRTVWQASVVQSILSNEKYKGDALLGKTYVEDCISKKVKVNAGERPQYYVENNHPAIIDAATFSRVQEELARRASKRKVKQTGTTTEQGKYCGKYALTELLICGECGTPYRRCTWTVGGKKRIVWRCINRLDYGKKYCHHSPTMEEAPLQNAIMDAVLRTAQIDLNVLQTLKQHIQLGLGAGAEEDKSVEIQIRIAQIDQEFKNLLNSVTAENQQELLTDPRITDLMTEKRQLEKELAEYVAAEQHRQNTASRLDNIFTILDGMKNHPLAYDDAVIRQILQCVIVGNLARVDGIAQVLVGLVGHPCPESADPRQFAVEFLAERRAGIHGQVKFFALPRPVGKDARNCFRVAGDGKPADPQYHAGADEGCRVLGAHHTPEIATVADAAQKFTAVHMPILLFSVAFVPI